MLTINQVVSHNLARARKSRGWTQEETAERLQEMSGKKWTAATLSASERAVATGRPRIFDANELVTFARVFEYPVAYFLLPIKPKSGAEEEQIFYQLAKREEREVEPSQPLMQALDVLSVAVPLKYPATFIEEANDLLRLNGISWQPDVRMDWDDGSDNDYETWNALTRGGQEDLSLDETKAIAQFADLVKKRPSALVLRVLADAMETPPRGAGDIPIGDPPF